MPMTKQIIDTQPTATRHCRVQFQGSWSLEMQLSSEQSAVKKSKFSTTWTFCNATAKCLTYLDKKDEEREKGASERNVSISSTVLRSFNPVKSKQGWPWQMHFNQSWNFQLWITAHLLCSCSVASVESSKSWSVMLGVINRAMLISDLEVFNGYLQEFLILMRRTRLWQNWISTTSSKLLQPQALLGLLRLTHHRRQN